MLVGGVVIMFIMNIVYTSVALNQLNSSDLKNVEKYLQKRNSPEYRKTYPFYATDGISLSTTPQKPDFRAPGRRISEIMCYGYIWEIKVREEAPARRRARRQEHSQNYGTQFSTVGGRNARPREFPHMGAVGWKGLYVDWVFKCGSSLISPKFVLTAAHCSKASSKGDIADPVPRIVRFGQINIVDLPVHIQQLIKNIHDKEIARIIVHPNYVSPYKYFDIALIELKNPIEVFNANLQPACLWTNPDASSLGTSVSIAGWGVTETGSSITSPDLQVVDLDLIESGHCNKLLQEQKVNLRNWFGLESHQICAGKLAGGADACQGDSGGPLQVKIPLPETTQEHIYYVIGITSFGIGCALPDVPGVYTRVSSFIDWIENIVWPSY